MVLFEFFGVPSGSLTFLGVPCGSLVFHGVLVVGLLSLDFPKFAESSVSSFVAVKLHHVRSRCVFFATGT